jgi:sugar lactone lactonase YvrE
MTDGEAVGFAAATRVRRVRPGRRGLVAGLIGLVALVSSACEPGWTNPLAGTGLAGSSGDGGAAVDATFLQPRSIVFEHATGAYYVVDNEACVVRRADRDGTIATVVGDGTCGYSGDGGPATHARIDPGLGLGGGLAQDAAGNLYLADTGNEVLRKITADGTITTLGSPMPLLSDVAVSTAGTLYVAAGFGGVVSVASDGTRTQVTDLVATSLAADPAGGIFFGVIGDGIHRLDEGSTTPTIAFAGLPFENEVILDLSVAASGHVYAGYAAEGKVIRFDPDGTAWTIAGNGSPEPDTGAQMGHAPDLALTPFGVAVTPNNGLLVTSGRVVYRIDHPATGGQPLPLNRCDPSFHPGMDLSGQDLSGMDFTDCDLTGADLGWTNLEGADLSGAILDGVRSGSVTGTPAGLPTGWVLRSGWLIGPGADLSDGYNVEGDFSGVDFTGVDLSNVLFGVPGSGPSFVDADLSGAVLSAPIMGFLWVDLSGADLSGLDLSTTLFAGTTMVGTKIDGTDFSDASLDTEGHGLLSSGLIGTPAALPEGWTLVDGTLIPPPAP